MPFVRTVYVVCNTYASGEFVGVCGSLEAAKTLLLTKYNPRKKDLTIRPRECDGVVDDDPYWVATDSEGHDWYGTIQQRIVVFPE